MQIIRLVEPGRVDRCIGFDELPKSLLTGVRRCGIEGFPRHWRTFFGIEKDAKDPQPFYFLEYTMLNSDKERWQEIGGYVRANASKKERLLDKMEDMAVPMAPDSYSNMTLEPEDIRIIVLNKPGEDDEEQKEEPVLNIEMATSVTPKRRGRPRKEPVSV